MKLIGNGKKDYFDYLIHQYGVDPLVVLDRRSITKMENYGMGSYYPAIKVHNAPNSGIVIKKEFRHSMYTEYVTNFLVVNGNVYPLVEYPTGKYQLANEDNTYMPEYRYRYLLGNVEKEHYPYRSDSMIELSKKIDRHCFIVSSNGNVQGLVPNLADVGLAKIVPAQEMYLQTVQFITEHLSDKLEEAKPQTNKEKIVSHGFDLKTSFRGK